MTINEAIFNVITTQRKKDMEKGAYETVKKAGYEVRYRGYGDWWEVRNKETYKCVYGRLNYRCEIVIEIGNKSKKLSNFDTCPIDFENFLNTPINRNYYNIPNYEPTKDKYWRLSNAKESVRWRNKEVEKLKTEIASKMKELEHDIKWLAEKENDLKNIRKEYKLIK